MNRRELLRLIAASTGTAMIGGTAASLLSGCATKPQASLAFSQENILLLDEIAETILPRTDTPGAKDAKVGEFMKVYVADCYTLEEQAIFHQGLVTFEEECKATYQRNFAALQADEREAFINKLDREAKASAASGQTHYFTMIK